MTDKERLDWLENRKTGTGEVLVKTFMGTYYLLPQGYTGQSIRQAIDQAMKSKKRRLRKR